MAEYIEREPMIEEMQRLIDNVSRNFPKATETELIILKGKYEAFMEYIKEQPAADVQPVKRGRWICNEELYYNGMAKCSCCEAEFYVEDLQTLQGDAECVKFCPNCGADMIGDENG